MIEMNIDVKKLGSKYAYGESSIVTDDVCYKTNCYQIELFGNKYDFSTMNKGDRPVKRFISEIIMELGKENDVGIPDKDFIIDNPEMFEEPFDFRDVPENQKEYFEQYWIWAISKNINLTWDD